MTRFLEELEVTECATCGGRWIETPDMNTQPAWMHKLDTLDAFGWKTHPTHDVDDDGAGPRICEWCRQTDASWYFGNDLNAGPNVSCLAALTDFEEMLIAPAHAAVQVWTLSELGEGAWVWCEEFRPLRVRARPRWSAC